MTKNDAHKTAMIVALEKSLGNVTDACKVVGIARNTHYTWMKEDEGYNEAVKSIGESAIDYVESKLFELIDGPVRTVMTEAGPADIKDPPHPTAVIFFLKTRAKHRGYVERQEISGPDNTPVQIIIPPII